jgi:hypothetical protein
MTGDIFGSDPQPAAVPPQPTTLEIPEELKELIGPGKKYADVKTALGSILPAQDHIAKLEREQAELREDLNGRLTVEESIKSLTSSAPTGHQPEGSLDQNRIVKLVQDTVVGLKTHETQATNLETVRNEIIEKLGSVDKANDFINQKAQELGVTTDRLKEIAANEPLVFRQSVMTSLGAQSEPTPTKMGGGDQTTPGQQQMDPNQGRRNFAWYQELRRKDPNTYHSVSNRSQMEKDAQEQGSEFYK